MPARASRRRTYRIGPVDIETIAVSPELQLRVAARLGQYAVDGAESGDGCAAPQTPADSVSAAQAAQVPPAPAGKIRMTLIGFEATERIRFRLPKDARLIDKNRRAGYYECRGLWIVLLRTATIIVNRKANKLLALAYPDDLAAPSYLEEFLHPLSELLRWNGLYEFHAAAVSLPAPDGSGEEPGVLLLGASGSGKTTLAVELAARGGFGFLGDDRCYLGETGRIGAAVWAFHEPVRYYPVNFAALPEVAAAGEASDLPVLPGGKRQVDLAKLYPERMRRRCRLRALLFPKYDPESAESRLVPLPPAEAMIAMLPLTMVCFDRATSERHFAFCARLANELPAARIVLGRDRERWPELVKKFMGGPPEK